MSTGRQAPRFHSAFRNILCRLSACMREGRTTGFTLIEVLVSVALMGILLISLLASLGYHLSIAERQSRGTVATLLAKQKMYELERNPGSSRGSFDDPFRDFEYETEVRPSALPGLSVISVRVRTDKDTVTMTGLVEHAEMR